MPVLTLAPDFSIVLKSSDTAIGEGLATCLAHTDQGPAEKGE